MSTAISGHVGEAVGPSTAYEADMSSLPSALPASRQHRRPARGSRHALERKLRPFVAAMLVVDALMIAASVFVAAELRSAFDIWFADVALSDDVIGRSAIAFVVVWLFSLFFRGSYDVRQVGSGTAEYAAVTRASWFAAAGIAVIVFLLQIPLSRGLYLISFVVGLPLLLLGRWLVRRVLNRVRAAGKLRHRTLVLGAPAAVEEIASVVRRNQAAAYELVGACIQTQADLSLDVLGRPRDVRDLVTEHRIDTVLVTGGLDSAASLRRIGWALEGLDVDLVVTPSLTEVAGTRVRMRTVAGLPLVHVEEPQAGAASGLRKRAFDVTIASMLLALGSPVFALLALLVKLEDGGPIFFRQQRAGRDGEDFDMIKFRSMSTDAEERLADLAAANEVEGGVLFKAKDDPRITRVGRVLRKFSLDELPQLINVVMGDMSLVGPRPPLGSEVAQYADDHHRRLLVRPGMTGLWQVSGRSDLSWDESVRLDLYYVDNWSMAGDLMIMLRTVRAVAAGRGAY